MLVFNIILKFVFCLFFFGIGCFYIGGVNYYCILLFNGGSNLVLMILMLLKNIGLGNYLFYVQLIYVGGSFLLLSLSLFEGGVKLSMVVFYIVL